MSENGGGTARRRRRGSATVAARTGVAPNSGDILWEIFLRLPPQPSSLPRVSLVCKRWRRLAADPEFLIRFRAHHRKAPLLGLFKEYGGWVSFTPVLGAPDRIPRRRFSMRIDYGGGAETHPFHGTLLGCRHGRVLAVDPRRREVLVCDPITGDQRRVALPPEFGTCGGAHGAVLCADGDEGHVHGGCHSSPFKVVLVQISFGPGHPPPFARVYSSETGVWSDPILAAEGSRGYVDLSRPSTLIGNSLYWWLHGSYLCNMEILEFDVGRQSLAVINSLPVGDTVKSKGCIQIIQPEDGRVGFAMLSYPSLEMWDLKDDCGGGVAAWVPRKTMNLDLVPNMRVTEASIVGYAEDDDAILIKFNNNIFIVQLESMQSRKLYDCFVRHQYHPFASFYSSGSAKRKA
ncbi:hypothetical protein QYE76_021265 [Lolium multiflorum]|uniref:F-box domain-containing protein n=1 Tax=Lolium multiflorum TaxID=4521 RepID=A0AAD8RAG3_LOLMU|nr:hypothetical protein QYE76_021265 [Lolium multiflorum]